MSTGDGSMGHPPEFADEFHMRDAQIECIAYFSFILVRDDLRSSLFWEDEEVAPEGEVLQAAAQQPPYLAFYDETVTAAADPEDPSRFTVRVDGFRGTFLLGQEIVHDQDVISVVPITPCTDCDDIHRQDLAAFLRVDSAAYFMRSWLPNDLPK